LVKGSSAGDIEGTLDTSVSCGVNLQFFGLDTPTAMAADPLGVCVATASAVLCGAKDGTYASANPAVKIAVTGLATSLALDDPNAYAAIPASGTIVRATRDGTSSTTIASGQALPTALVLSGTNIYWANNGDGTIMRAAK
jgi:hypothetical protein